MSWALQIYIRSSVRGEQISYHMYFEWNDTPIQLIILKMPKKLNLFLYMS